MPKWYREDFDPKRKWSKDVKKLTWRNPDTLVKKIQNKIRTFKKKTDPDGQY